MCRSTSRRTIGARELAMMKPTAILINTCRGPVVDEGALYDALISDRIRGPGSMSWSRSRRHPSTSSSPCQTSS
jgi:lactate dehydrogenase-like 2-hydroxyacid dehydrogenase